MVEVFKAVGVNSRIKQEPIEIRTFNACVFCSQLMSEDPRQGILKRLNAFEMTASEKEMDYIQLIKGRVATGATILEIGKGIQKELKEKGIDISIPSYCVDRELVRRQAQAARAEANAK